MTSLASKVRKPQNNRQHRSSACAWGVFDNFSLITDRLRANVALKHPCSRLCDALRVFVLALRIRSCRKDSVDASRVSRYIRLCYSMNNGRLPPVGSSNKHYCCKTTARIITSVLLPSISSSFSIKQSHSLQSQPPSTTTSRRHNRQRLLHHFRSPAQRPPLFHSTKEVESC
jgi:hypothetical protein